MVQSQRGKKRQTKPHTHPKVLSVGQVADLLGCCGTTVRSYIKAGKLVASQPGNRFFIQRSDFDDFLKSSQVKSVVS